MRKTKVTLLGIVAIALLSFVGCQSSSMSISDLRSAAERGDAEAQYELGNAYYYGKGVPQDYKEAQVWYGKAAAGYKK